MKDLRFIWLTAVTICLQAPRLKLCNQLWLLSANKKVKCEDTERFLMVKFMKPIMDVLICCFPPQREPSFVVFFLPCEGAAGILIKQTFIICAVLLWKKWAGGKWMNQIREAEEEPWNGSRIQWCLNLVTKWRKCVHNGSGFCGCAFRLWRVLLYIKNKTLKNKTAQ